MKCEIIRDLLPSYIDGLTSEESNQEIENHLDGCESCQKYYDEMKKEVCVEEKKDKDIEPFLKIKKATLRKIGIAVILTAFIGAMGIEFYKAYFLAGQSMSSDEVSIQYVEDESYNILRFEPTDEDEVVYVGYTENKEVGGKMPLETISLLKFPKSPAVSFGENEYRMYFIDEDTVMCLYSLPENVDFDEEDFIAIEFNDCVKTIKMSDLKDGNIQSLQ